MVFMRMIPKLLHKTNVDPYDTFQASRDSQCIGYNRVARSAYLNMNCMCLPRVKSTCGQWLLRITMQQKTRTLKYLHNQVTSIRSRDRQTIISSRQ
jgi:hypothetical protein